MSGKLSINIITKVLLVSIITVGFNFFGCNYQKNLPEVSIKNISRLLFKEVVHISITYTKLSGFQKLSAEQIIALERSINKGTRLLEIEENEYYNLKDTIVFDFEWPKSRGGNLKYDPDTNYMYVEKETVFRNETEKFLGNSKLMDKYLIGGYRFKPSIDIKKIIKRENFK